MSNSLSLSIYCSMAAVRNASTFRTFLEKCLPDVFESFNEVLRAPGLGRITANLFEEKVRQHTFLTPTPTVLPFSCGITRFPRLPALPGLPLFAHAFPCPLSPR